MSEDIILSIRGLTKRYAAGTEALKGLDKKDQKTLAKLLGQIEANLSAVVEDEVDDESAEEPIETAA